MYQLYKYISKITLLIISNVFIIFVAIKFFSKKQYVKIIFSCQSD